jgi:hypothetical protein
VKLVAEALSLRAHSEIDERAAMELAVHVLYALDHIPESRRRCGKPATRPGHVADQSVDALGDVAQESMVVREHGFVEFPASRSAMAPPSRDPTSG